MSLSPIGSVLSSLALNPGSQAISQTTTATQQSSQDSSQLHPIATLFSQLDQLSQTNPQAYQTFLTQAQTEVNTAASSQPDGQTKDFLHALSGVFQRGAENPGQPLGFLHPGTNNFDVAENPVADNVVQGLNEQATQALNIQ
jgi:hypothetical protein